MKKGVSVKSITSGVKCILLKKVVKTYGLFTMVYGIMAKGALFV